jgi:hypothetical protein
MWTKMRFSDTFPLTLGFRHSVFDTRGWTHDDISGDYTHTKTGAKVSRYEVWQTQGNVRNLTALFAKRMRDASDQQMTDTPTE